MNFACSKMTILAPQLLPISTYPPNMLPTTTSSNATYYPMQVFYYPTPPISPSVYLQTGQMHPAPMTLVLRGK